MIHSSIKRQGIDRNDDENGVVVEAKGAHVVSLGVEVASAVHIQSGTVSLIDGACRDVFEGFFQLRQLLKHTVNYCVRPLLQFVSFEWFLVANDAVDDLRSNLVHLIHVKLLISSHFCWVDTKMISFRPKLQTFLNAYWARKLNFKIRISLHEKVLLHPNFTFSPLFNLLPLISLSTAKTHYFMSSNNLDACFINVKANSMIANKKGFMREEFHHKTERTFCQ